MIMMMMIIIIIIIIATIRICVAYCDLEFLGLTPETPRQSYIFSIGKIWNPPLATTKMVKVLYIYMMGVWAPLF